LNDQLINLIGQLEKESADLVSADTAHLMPIIERRREILSRISNALSEGGSPVQREELAKRIKSLYDRDSRLVVALQLQCDDIKKQLDDVLQVRSAARGYRPGEGDRPSKVDRIA
jgi:hypothetical protein